MTHYTVKQVARLSGVSVRTLHHYHDLGLLTPALIGENRYRYYRERELLRLQQILFYREFGIPLNEIAAFLDRPNFDHVAALEQHRARLQAETKRTRQLIRTIDRTIAQLKGAGAMRHADLYKGFSPEKQAAYEDWLTDAYGDGMEEKIEATRAYLKDWSDRDHADAMAELAELEAAIAKQMAEGTAPQSADLDPLLDRHRAWVARMWGRDCTPDAYAGLADLYLAHPDFAARYEAIASGFTEFLTEAMKAYADRRKGTEG
ncbi:MAG: MerR family transcriptional regulator [Pseudomonadota bacterium]